MENEDISVSFSDSDCGVSLCINDLLDVHVRDSCTLIETLGDGQIEISNNEMKAMCLAWLQVNKDK